MAMTYSPARVTLPRVDEYARLQAENEAEAARMERAGALREQRDRTVRTKAVMDAQSSHFRRNFKILTGGQAATSPANREPDQAKRIANQAQRLADYYGFYYGQY